MNNNITTYYIPNNPNVDKGLIYTLYLNNNKNLDAYIIKEKELITELTNQCNEFIALRKEDKFE